MLQQGARILLLGAVATCAHDRSATAPHAISSQNLAAFSQTLLTSGNDPINERVYVTASIAPEANALVTVAVLGFSALGTPPVPTLSGGGMARWDVVATVTFDSVAIPAHRLTIFRALSAAPESGPITITSSMTLSHLQWSVSQWTGVETGGENGADAVQQTAAARGDSVNGLTVSLAPLANPDNVVYGAFGVRSRVGVVTPGEGFTEISEDASGEYAQGDLQTEWGTNLANIAATWTRLNAGALGIEINTRPAAAVAAVAVDPAATSVGEGETVQLAATVQDANGNTLTGRVVTWASSDTAVATVTETGLVTGEAAGSVTITAASEGQVGTASVTVSAAAAFSHTLLTFGTNPSNLKVYATAAIAPAPNALVTVAVLEHSSLGTPPIPTLSGGGMAAWDVIATVTFDTVATPSRRLTIFRALSAAPGSGPITITSSMTLSHCQWSVSQWTGVETSGANGAGAVRQTGAARGDRVNGLTVSLAPLANPDNVVYGAFGVRSNVAAVTPGAGFTEIAEQPSGDSPLGDLQTEWGTNLANVAATWASLNAGALAIEISTGPPAPVVPVAAVEVTPATAAVATGSTVQLLATPKDANGNPLTGRVVAWASSDPAVATVTGTGLVTGKAAGSVTITAESEQQSGTAAVTVTWVPVAAVDVTPATAAVAMGSSVQLLATPKDAAGNSLTGRAVTWASSDLAVATVTGSGVVTGVSPGSSTITATSEGQVGTASVTVSEGVVLVGAGDIAVCGNQNDEATALLLDAFPGPVFTAGDNVYSNGTASEFTNCYDPTWGRHKARTYPVPGNHDYNTSSATGYYNYFGAAAGDPTQGYYSFEHGEWHVLVLNSNISRTASSPQVQWLRAQLAASTKLCQLAIWHHPRWTTSIGRVTNSSVKPFWDTLYARGADLIVNAHDHSYQRYAPQTPEGFLDPNGLRQITVGTGGASMYEFEPPGFNVEVRNNVAHGVLKLTLRGDGYDWKFLPIAGQTFTDAGTGACRGPRGPPPNQPPTARPGGPYRSEAVVPFDGGASTDPDNNTPLTYAWNFGDGTTGTGVKPTRTYGANGVYTVTLVVTDARGAPSAPVTTTATIDNLPPTVNAGPDVTLGTGQPFNLSAVLGDPGLNDGPWTYVIAWGDGATESGSTATQGASISASHLYAAAGQYVAVVTVTDKDGGTASDAVTATVLAGTPGTITHTLLTAGTNAINQNTYSTTAFAPGPSALITVAVLEHSSLGTPPIPTLSGGGMTTWDVVATVTFDGTTPNRRLTIFRALNAQPGNGPLTITSTMTLSHLQWIVSQWDGVDVSGVNGAGAVGQTGSATGIAVSGLTVALASFGNPNNVGYGAFGVAATALAVTPGSGFTEISEVPSGEGTPGDLETERGTNRATIVATWTSLTAGALGVEIRARFVP